MRPDHDNHHPATDDHDHGNVAHHDHPHYHVNEWPCNGVPVYLDPDAPANAVYFLPRDVLALDIPAPAFNWGGADVD